MSALIRQYRELHEEGHFAGLSILPWVEDIAALVRRTGAETLLDYGCGKGMQYVKHGAHEAWGGIMPHLYDPGVSGLSKPPEGLFDGVISTDVAEHIPEGEVDAYIEALKRHAGRFVFVSICCRPANRLLPDGRNAHLTIRRIKWWKKKFARAFAGSSIIVDIREAP
jgi:hypothetical protein